MWDLPRPGLESMSPALAGGFLTTVPPGKPSCFFQCLVVLDWMLDIAYLMFGGAAFHCIPLKGVELCFDGYLSYL